MDKAISASELLKYFKLSLPVNLAIAVSSLAVLAFSSQVSLFLEIPLKGLRIPFFTMFFYALSGCLYYLFSGVNQLFVNHKTTKERKVLFSTLSVKELATLLDMIGSADSTRFVIIGAADGLFNVMAAKGILFSPGGTQMQAISYSVQPWVKDFYVKESKFFKKLSEGIVNA